MDNDSLPANNLMGGFGSPGFLLSDPNLHYRNLAEFMNWTEKIQFPKRIEIDRSPEDLPAKALSYKRRLALPSASVLGSLDGSEGLLMRKTSSDAEEVWGGTTDGLIVHATRPGAQVLVYQEAFLTTYRTFIEPGDLIRRLVWRYQHFAADTDTDQAKRKAARNTFSLIVRVVDDLCGYEMKKEILSEVNSFVYRLVEDGELNLARLLRQRLLDRLQDKTGFKNHSPHPSMTSSVSPEQSSKPIYFMDVKSEHLAEQLTRMDADLFQKIEVSEMLWWAQEQCEEKSPNLVNFTEHFNKMSYWTRTRVLEQQEHKEKERIFLKFIKIMKHLKRMGNFNSFLAILSALESGPVRRLEWSRNITEAMKELSEIMDSSQSFKKYRTALAETKPPCLPYMPFEIKKDEDVVPVFGNFENFMTEDSIWELSESIKPRPGGRRNFVI